MVEYPWEWLASPIGEENAMARVYVSYNRNDQDFVAQVVALLKRQNHQILTNMDLLGLGSDWRRTLHEGLRSADAFVVFLSEASMQSPLVLSELGAARFRSMETERLLSCR
jgi:hypothetical protein